MGHRTAYHRNHRSMYLHIRNAAHSVVRASTHGSSSAADRQLRCIHCVPTTAHSGSPFALPHTSDFMERKTSSFSVEVLEGGRDEKWLRWGMASTQGRREDMEDAHLVNLDLESSLMTNDVQTAKPATTTALFGIFDGHGGKEVAAYAAKRLGEHVVRTDAFAHGNLCSSVFDAFVTMDEAILRDTETQQELRLLSDRPPSDASSDERLVKGPSNKPIRLQSGSTAVVALVRSGEVVLGHAGDSRALVVDKSGSIQHVTQDHKPNSPAEAERIYAAGGFVTPRRPGAVPRVGGTLALSRALGDAGFKGNENLSPEEQIVTAAPDTSRLPITEDTHFMVLACDGVWDVLQPEQVAETVRSMLSDNQSLGAIALKVVEHTLDHAHGTGPSQDNITLMVVVFGSSTHGTPSQLLDVASRC